MLKKIILKLYEYKENLNDMIYATDMQLKEMDPESSEDRLITWYSQGTVSAYKEIQGSIETEIQFLCSKLNADSFNIKEHLLNIALSLHEKRNSLLSSLQYAETEKDKRFIRGQADCYNDMLAAYFKTFVQELAVDKGSIPGWIKPYILYLS